MKILITGADGLLGSNVVRVLLERGHQIRALIQQGKNPITLEGLDIPHLAILLYGVLGSLISAISGKRPTVSYPMAKIACDGQYFSAQRAVRVLNLPQTPIEEGIRESFKWMKANGVVKGFL